MESLDELLEEELKDIYNAENQLVKSLPKVAKKASAAGLKEAFTNHLEETKVHVERLEKIGKSLGIKLTGKKCAAMEGLIEECKEVLEEDGEPAILDAALISAAQRVEHYEIAAYGNARTLAEHLGHSEVVDILQETLDEEGAADKLLTEVAQNEVFPAAGGEEEAEDSDEKSSGGARMSQRRDPRDDQAADADADTEEDEKESSPARQPGARRARK